MKLRALVLLVAMFASTLFVIVACSKSTSPNYGGGSGGGTPPGGSFNFTFPATGTSNARTFSTAGSIGYHCAAHAGMVGTVVVSAGASADSALVAVGVDGVGADAHVFTPATVTIKPGGYVRWVNQSAMINHTVTSN